MSDALKFDPERGIVWRGAERLTIEPKGIDVLRLLAREPGTLVTAEQLQKQVWRRRHLGEGVISQTLYKLRRALADDGLIQSVRGEGWRLTRPIVFGSFDEESATATNHENDGSTVTMGTAVSAGSIAPSPESASTPVAVPPQTSRFPRTRMWAGVLIAPLIVVLLGAAYWLRASSGLREPSLAVMPFVDQSPDQRLAKLGANLRAKIAFDVQGVPGFRVASEDAIARFRGDPNDEQQLWLTMAANVLIQGDLMPSPEHPDGYVLTLRITDHSGHGLNWNRQYVHTAGDSGPLFERVRIDLYRHLDQRGRSPSTGNSWDTQHPGAREAFLRAATLGTGNSPDDYRRALASLELAVELDPNYAEAWSELGGLLGSRLFVPDNADELRQSRQRAIAAMDRAITLSPDYVAAILMRSEIRHNYAFDWSGSAADVARAEQRVGLRADVLLQKARLAASLGDLEAAIRMNDEAHAKDPMSGARRNAGWHLLSLGRYAEARSYLLEEHKIRPWESSLNYYLGLCDLFEGLPQDALKRFGYADSDYRLTGVAMANFDLGRHAEAEQALGTLIARSPDQSAYEIATVYGHIGNADEAFLWLDHAIDVRDGGLEYLAFDPRFRKLRDDPRMAERLRQIKHPKWLVSGVPK